MVSALHEDQDVKLNEVDATQSFAIQSLLCVIHLIIHAAQLLCLLLIRWATSQRQVYDASKPA